MVVELNSKIYNIQELRKPKVSILNSDNSLNKQYITLQIFPSERNCNINPSLAILPLLFNMA